MRLKCNKCKVVEEIEESNGRSAWTTESEMPVLLKGAGDGKWYHAFGHGCFNEALEEESQ